MEGSPGRLPPGQFATTRMPRFGLGRYSRRVVRDAGTLRVEVLGGTRRVEIADAQLRDLPRVGQVSDFHCVTTWSVRGVRWSGWRFAQVYHELILPLASPANEVRWLVFRGGDGFSACLLLEDLLAPDVLFAERIDGRPLGAEHGGPLRLVAPAQYGYKNLKHLVAIELLSDRTGYRFPAPYPQFMDHPRARVALEERARIFPAWLLRPIYRALIASTRATARRALERHRRD